MDAQAVMLGISGIGSVAVGIAIGRQMTMRRDINNIAGKVHKIEDWRNATLPKHLEGTYARRDTVAIELGHIRESQARIEQQLSQLVGNV